MIDLRTASEGPGRTGRNRGVGIGRALVQAALKIARQRPGIVRVELGVADQSAAARHVYAQCGFRETAFEAKTGRHDMALEREPRPPADS